jgi:hypothetical protein
LVRYQSEYVKDRHVEATHWTTCKDNDSIMMARTMTFTHPIKNSMGLGPSEARTTRQQRLWRFEDRGLLLENITQVDGIPASDAFHLRDRWLIEQQGQGGAVRLSSSFEIRFTKRSLFRGFIEKSVKKETGDWWTGYSTMLQEALLTTDNRVEATGRSMDNVSPKPDISSLPLEALAQSMFRLLALAVLILLVILLFLGLQFVVLREEISALRNELVAVVGQQQQCTLI